MNKRRRIMSDNSSSQEGVQEFNYTGTVQETVLEPGIYKLQCWGAQGSTNQAYPEYNLESMAGGKGGYSEGILKLAQQQTVYVFVGGMQTSEGNGGWNGGGAGLSSVTECYYGFASNAPGGGATDIATVTSTMTYSNGRTDRSSASYLSRMIVAGGGSGGISTYYRYFNEELFQSFTYDICQHDSNYTSFWYEMNDLEPGTYMTVKVNDGSYFNIYYYNQAGQQTSWNRYDSGQYFYLSNYTGYFRIYTSFNYSHNYGSQEIFSIYTSDNTYSTGFYSSEGYYGGGIEGGSGSDTYKAKQNSAGTSGGFGYGGNGNASSYTNISGGGGGGWYGGGSLYGSPGYPTSSSVIRSGGGSGFVNIAANASYRPSGYTGLQLETGITIDGNSSFPNITGTSDEIGHSGNGYAKIIKLDDYTVTIVVKDQYNDPIDNLSIDISGPIPYSGSTNSNGIITFSCTPGTYTIQNTSLLSFSTYSFTVINSNMTVNIIATPTAITNISYSGTYNEILLFPGIYKLECWGAQGGSYSTTNKGGKGGYSVGEIILEDRTTVYACVGGKGTGGTTLGSKAGGYNGGGDGYAYSDAYFTCSGGGASDIRIGSNSLYARVIVAGGGGGSGSYSASQRFNGGYGGGNSGGTGGQYSTSYIAGTGGTQTARGTSYYGSSSNSTSYGTLAAFGKGGSVKSGKTSYQVSGGGGGWYGGGYARMAGAGGGSGYVYNDETSLNYPSGCLLNSNYYLTKSETKNGSTSFPSTSGSTETGHTGNGYVRITYLYRPGVWAYYSDGSMRNYDTATQDAIGVALITRNCRFVIGKNDLTDPRLDRKYFGGYGKDISDIGIVITSSYTTAMSDFDGYNNTTKIINAFEGYSDTYSTGAPACEACRAAFNGNGYMGAFGEWYEVYSNFNALNRMMLKVGGETLDSMYWTSTAYDATQNMWLLMPLSGNQDTYNRESPGHTRAFMQL